MELTEIFELIKGDSSGLGLDIECVVFEFSALPLKRAPESSAESLI